MKRSMIVAATLLLTACIPQIRPAVFRDPMTGQVAQCNSMSGGGAFPIINAQTAQGEIDTCAAAYERLGWQRQ
jgi:hypothetical protein